MTNKSKLRLCNEALLLLSALILFSAIHLEVTSCHSISWICIHIIIGIVFFAFVLWHIRLHFPWHKLHTRLFHTSNRALKCLLVFALLTILSSLLATVVRLFHDYHSPIGALHGKFGFIFLFFVAAHAIKRHRYYYRTLFC